VELRELLKDPAARTRATVSRAVRMNQFMSARRPFTLSRFVSPVPRNATAVAPDRDIGVDTLGFLRDPSRDERRGYRTDAVPLADVEALRCAVILGEPGMGKSVALESLGGGDAIRHNLADFTTDQFLVKRVFENPDVCRWAASEDTELTVVLDSLDECQLRVETVASIVNAELGKLPAARLRLRIACRPAVWPALLGAQLCDIFGEDSVGVYELLPLCREDIAEAAVASNIDPNLFLSAIYACEAGPMAARPVTLKLLLELFAADGALPRSRAELYGRGCEWLAKEHSPTRKASRRVGMLTPRQRVEVAGDVAAVMLLSGQSTITTETAGPDDDLLAVEDLVGEYNDPVLSHTTAAVISEVLDTALFNATGPGRLAFAHRTYAEYLAAARLARLARCGQPDEALFRLLSVETSSGRRVVPQLQEVAAWLASLRPTVFRRLVDASPAAALGCDLDEGMRATVAWALLDQAVDGRHLTGWGFDYGRYAKLDFPGLADLIRPLIADPVAPIAARGLAILIAEACEKRELLPDLISVALDSAYEYRTRVQAALAVSHLGSGDDFAPLMPCALGLAGEDPDDELKGVALKALYPSRMTIGQVLDTLTPPRNENLIGSYQLFLARLPDLLPAGDLPAALNWLGRLRGFGSPGTLMHSLASSLLELAWDRLGEDDVLAAYASLFVDSVQHHPVLPGFEWDELRANHDTRLRLFDAVLRVHVARGFDTNSQLLRMLAGYENAGAVIERLRREPDPTMKAAFADVAFSLLEYHHDPLPLRDAAVAVYLPLGERLEALFAPRPLRPELAGQLAEQQRSADELERVTREVEARRVARVQARLDHMLSRLDDIERGDNDAWVGLMDGMFQSEQSNFVRIRIDLRQMDSWSACDDETRTRILRAAEGYIQGASAPATERPVTSRPKLGDWAGVCALVLSATNPDTPPPSEAVCARWAWPIVSVTAWSGTDLNGTPRRLATLAYQSAPGPYIHAIDLLFEFPDRGQGFQSELMPDPADERLETCLLGHIRAGRLTRAERRLSLAALLGVGRSETVAYLTECLIGTERTAALEAAELLCANSPATQWPAVWAKVTADTEFGRDLFLGLAAGNEHVVTANLSAGMTEGEAAELYLWLMREFPPETDTSGEDDDWTTPRESLAQLRGAVLSSLQNRGTAAASDEIDRIARELPDRPWLRASAEAARHHFAAVSWVPLRPADIRQFLTDPRLRVVATGGDLLALLRESLVRLQALLHGETPASPDLWNVVPAGRNHLPRCTPKDEAALSDYIARHFRTDLAWRGVVVGREVEIRRMGEKGERTDIHVTAVSPAAQGYAKTVTVIVEVKGCWNRGRETDIVDQLRDRYLKNNACRHGLYVVGWFTCEKWATDDRSSRGGPASDAADERPKFDRLAATASEGGVTIGAWILDCGLR
jgi:hypothetical protein